MIRNSWKLKLLLASLLLGIVIGISDTGTVLTRRVFADDGSRECASGQLCKSAGCIIETHCCAFTSDYIELCPPCNACQGSAIIE
jgi:hypothetical protein